MTDVEYFNIYTNINKRKESGYITPLKNSAFSQFAYFQNIRLEQRYTDYYLQLSPSSL